MIPTGFSETNDKEYFEAINRLTEAKKYFENHREIAASGAISRIEVLFNQVKRGVFQVLGMVCYNSCCLHEQSHCEL